MEYEGYLKVLPDPELIRQHRLASTEVESYKLTRDELATEIARRGIADYISPEVVEG